MNPEIQSIIIYTVKAREGIVRIQSGSLESRARELLELIAKGLEIFEVEMSEGRLEIPTERAAQLQEPVEGIAEPRDAVAAPVQPSWPWPWSRRCSLREPPTRCCSPVVISSAR